MIFGCRDHVNVLGKKITGVFHQNLSKDMPSSSPTLDIDGNFMFLSPMTPMTNYVDKTLKEYTNSEDGEVVKFFQTYKQAHGRLQNQRQLTTHTNKDSEEDIRRPSNP